MSPLSITRIALALLVTTPVVAPAQDKPFDSGNALVTVTNKSDLELSLSLTLLPVYPTPTPFTSATDSPTNPAPAASNRITEFQIRQTVQPQQQAVIQIPKGSYIVDASTPYSPRLPTEVRRAVRRSSNVQDYIATNEVWTFELETGPGASLDSGDNVIQWKRKVQPTRPVKAVSQATPPDTSGLRSIPERTHRLAPGGLQPPVDPVTQRILTEIEQNRTLLEPQPPSPLRTIPTRTLQLAPPP